MSKLSALTNTWDTIKEVDLQPLRSEALQGVAITIIGASGSGRSTLAEQLRRMPLKPEVETNAPITILDFAESESLLDPDLVVLVVDSRKTNVTSESELILNLREKDSRFLVLINQFEDNPNASAIETWFKRKAEKVIHGSLLDPGFLERELSSAVMELLPDRLLSLGRHYPLFRVAIAHHLINDTCFTNAAYSFSTGVAEIVPVLNIPLTVTDMIILSKNQAFLVYKLGLALGLSTRWQDYLAEFGGILGSGFLWRQVARSLVGLVPLWGIAPKVAISYAGTFVVGHVVLQWYLTGRHLSAEQMRALYKGALGRGREVARRLAKKAPRPRLKLSRPRRFSLPKRGQVCPHCGRRIVKKAEFCHHCGKKLANDDPRGSEDAEVQRDE